jgi:L-phenylalanine/L-methionine N-acetyltransferase
MEDNMPDSLVDTKIAGPLPGSAPPLPAGLIIRAREPSDWEEIAALTELPKVRWGTLRLPYTRKDQWRKKMENLSEESTGIVAVLHGRIVGSAGIEQHKGRRRHVGDIGMSVHDDFHRRSIGSALVAALIDVADNWLDLKRLELTVYVDNKAAIRLYERPASRWREPFAATRSAPGNMWTPSSWPGCGLDGAGMTSQQWSEFSEGHPEGCPLEGRCALRSLA